MVVIARLDYAGVDEAAALIDATRFACEARMGRVASLLED